jgi:UDP-N-acetylmuramate-alanine ligase
VALEPSSSTARSSIFQKEYLNVLSGVKTVILVDPKRDTTAKNYGNLDCRKLIDGLVCQKQRAYLVKEISELKEKIKEEADDEKVILFLSNGQFLGLWESEMAREFKF